MIVMDGDTSFFLGLKSFRRGLSPLQTEFKTFIWAMESLITASKTNIGFAYDCSEFIFLQ